MTDAKSESVPPTTAPEKTAQHSPLWRKISGFLTEFVLPRYWGSAVLAICLWNVVRMGSDGVGVSNLFRDVPELHDRFWEWDSLSSPTAWTSAVLAMAVGLMLVAPLFQWYFKPHNERMIGARVLTILLVLFGVVIHAVLLWGWYSADGSALLPGEIIRAAAGVVVGWAAFALLLQLLQWVMAYIRNIFGPTTVLLQDPHAVDALLKDTTSPLLRMVAPFAMRQAAFMNANLRDTAAALFFGIMGVGLYLMLKVDSLLPGVALICLFLLVFVFFHFLSAATPVVKIGTVLFVVLLFVSAFGKGDDGFKLTFDGINGPGGENHYALRDLHYDIEAGDARFFDDFAEGCAADGFAGGPVDMAHAMNGWLEHARAAQQREKPKMVVVATSGGAYRAAFWTSLVLDELIYADRTDPALEGVARSVRFITGASGGMVGAAYFAAMAQQDGFPIQQKLTELQLETDIRNAQLNTVARPAQQGAYFHAVANPFPRDSLSAVSKHIIRKDLPSLIIPGRVDVDRGKVLEKHWETIDVPFGALRAGEAEGWRPSILFSPMLIESSKPLVISNLRLSEIPDARNGEIVEFHRAFPCARGTFSMATAARMNATFPYISPAVSLPSNPRRRVVDAGYYDNYGVSLITGLFGSDGDVCSFHADRRDVRGNRVPFCLSKWLAQNTSGIILIEIRAFELGTSSERTQHCPEPDAVADERGRLEFLTSPIDAVLSARGGTMVLRNEQVLRHYADSADAVPMQRLVLVNCVNGGMNWIMPKDELDDMRTQFRLLWDQEKQFLWRTPGNKVQADEELLSAGDYLRRAWAE